ncbi:hypothetical protein F6X40_17440 [Paraburkholderia sp. UCT31]|uniref:hypothetical protein n=1 Tax=Paraburkholderia sp. UCT31 TaxID=2615209 RepID=UPI00165670A2|nr:hypothetical protein [Paraburkholderia sp. UCT31]MBC8738546.1 hypothetical protein [Paraburkholderia sp. UCT31]
MINRDAHQGVAVFIWAKKKQREDPPVSNHTSDAIDEAPLAVTMKNCLLNVFLVPMKSVETEPNVDALQLATQCRAWVKSRYKATSCIESAFLFERTAHHLGLGVKRAVCQATAMTPLLAQAVAEGRDAEALMSEPGYWAVGVGLPESSDDFVGRKELDKNRFVGHVVCLTERHLIDPSVDQMSRPAKGLFLDSPLIASYEGKAIVVGFGQRGAIVRYVLHLNVAPPAPRTDKKLERAARSLAQEWLNSPRTA